jgi:hypothetical protein
MGNESMCKAGRSNRAPNESNPGPIALCVRVRPDQVGMTTGPVGSTVVSADPPIVVDPRQRVPQSSTLRSYASSW